MEDIIKKDFIEAKSLLTQFINGKGNLEKIEQAGIVMVNSLRNGGKIISCGNGGSMSDAMHFAEELSGRFRDDRPSIAAVSISDPTHLTCAANDYGFESIFSRYIESLGNKGDVLLSISTSGNSANIIKAAETARLRGVKVVGLTGKSGGKLAELCDVEIRVPHFGYADRIQEIHIKVIHTLINYIERYLFQ